MMPYVVHWLIFTVIPEKTPIPIRWLLSPIMNKIKTALFVPELVKATNMVCGHPLLRLCDTINDPLIHIRLNPI